MNKIISASLVTFIALSLSARTEINNTISNKIVIYNNTALVTENKKVNIDKGVSELVYRNVSPQVISDSVSVNI